MGLRPAVPSIIDRIRTTFFALPVYVARCCMMKMEPPTIRWVEVMASPPPAYLPPRLDRAGWSAITGAEPGQEIELSREHVATNPDDAHDPLVAATSSGIGVSKLKEGSIAEPGPAMGIRDRQSGCPGDEVRTPPAYTGDTTAWPVDRRPDLFDTKILITEIFLHPSEPSPGESTSSAHAPGRLPGASRPLSQRAHHLRSLQRLLLHQRGAEYVEGKSTIRASANASCCGFDVVTWTQESPDFVRPADSRLVPDVAERSSQSARSPRPAVKATAARRMPMQPSYACMGSRIGNGDVERTRYAGPRRRMPDISVYYPSTPHEQALAPLLRAFAMTRGPLSSSSNRAPARRLILLEGPPLRRTRFGYSFPDRRSLLQTILFSTSPCRTTTTSASALRSCRTCPQDCRLGKTPDLRRRRGPPPVRRWKNPPWATSKRDARRSRSSVSVSPNFSRRLKQPKMASWNQRLAVRQRRRPDRGGESRLLQQPDQAGLRPRWCSRTALDVLATGRRGIPRLPTSRPTRPCSCWTRSLVPGRCGARPSAGAGPRRDESCRTRSSICCCSAGPGDRVAATSCQPS